MKILALTISGILAAPLAMANCNDQFDRIENRIENANMAQENEQVLNNWLSQQRDVYSDATRAQCIELAAEIERQMVQKGYFAATTTYDADETVLMQRERENAELVTDDRATLATTRRAEHEVELDQAEIEVDAPGARIAVDQPASRIDVQQQAADVEVQMQQPQVIVEVPEPRVQVTQPPPQVTVNQADPKVTVNQKEPIVNVTQPDPNVSVTQAEPDVTVRQGDPNVSVSDSPAVVDVNRAKPQVEVNTSDSATVQIRESDRDARDRSDEERAVAEEGDWQPTSSSSDSSSASSSMAGSDDESDSSRGDW